MPTEAKGALHGIVVCDFTWVGAGPIATNILAQCGADVIKIESARRPDLLRLTGPFKDGAAGGLERSGYFANRNPNKRSISLNMEHPAAREAALRLIRKSDIVINNFRVGQMDRWGLGWEAVRKANPRAIYVTMSLQGTTGPHASFMGFGVNLNALCGMTAQTGAPGRKPYGTGTHYTDHVAVPGHALFGIMAALLQREQTGEGQTVEVSQLAASIAMKPMDAMAYASNGTIPGPAGLADPDAAPHGVYATNEPRRWLALAVFSDEQWQALKQVMGSPLWAEDPRFANLAARKQNEDALNEGVEQWTQGWKAEALQARLHEKGICAGVVHDGRSVTEDEHLRARGFWWHLDHPVMGKTLYNRAPFLLSETPLRMERAAPLLGEHTEEVLVGMLGYSTDELERMRQEGALE